MISKRREIKYVAGHLSILTALVGLYGSWTCNIMNRLINGGGVFVGWVRYYQCNINLVTCRLIILLNK